MRPAVFLLAGMVAAAGGAWFGSVRSDGEDAFAAPAGVKPLAVVPAPPLTTDSAAARGPQPALRSTVSMDDAPALSPEQSQLSTEEIVARSLPGVVTVETGSSTGSGFFISADTVITNAHVVRGAAQVTLRSSSGVATSARVVSSDAGLDLAVVRVQEVSADQRVLPMAEPADVRIGAEVVAIGSPLGLRNTVTRGIVSGMRDAKGVALIQTDAAINPGNSGGPLIDRFGRVIGVNTLKLAGSSESIGFAVAIHHSRALLGGAVDAASGSERRRAFSLQRYDEAVAALAARVAPVDAEWRQAQPPCTEGPERSSAHAWIGFAGGSPPRLKPTSRCAALQPFFQEWARRTKTALSLYERTALAAGATAGELAAIRERRELHWVDSQ